MEETTWAPLWATPHYHPHTTRLRSDVEAGDPEELSPGTAGLEGRSRVLPDDWIGLGGSGVRKRWSDAEAAELAAFRWVLGAAKDVGA